jgi:23S rRNA pseudouridine1911/1915/1917 synthase
MMIVDDGAASSRLRVTSTEAGMRADVFLAMALPSLSRTRIRQKIQTGESLLNGKRYATSARLKEADEITVQWRGPRAGGPEPAGGDALPVVAVLYEDDVLLAVNKPAGMASHPMGQTQSGTLIQAVRALLAARIRESLARGDAGFYPNLVSRLDVFTSGIVLVAKTGDALTAMHRLVAERRIVKEYAAVVEGTVRDEQGRIELPLGLDAKSATRVKMAACADGLACVTEYRVRRRLPGHTFLSVFPLTGRQHQVRAHLAAIGHPILGDLLYKDEALFLRYRENGGVLDASLPARHCLHAERVAFTHPASGEKIALDAPIPADFMELVASVE